MTKANFMQMYTVEKLIEWIKSQHIEELKVSLKEIKETSSSSLISIGLPDLFDENCEYSPKKYSGSLDKIDEDLIQKILDFDDQVNLEKFFLGHTDKLILFFTDIVFQREGDNVRFSIFTKYGDIVFNLEVVE